MVDEGRPNAVGHRRGRGDGLNLLFTGHMDTSYSGDEEHLAGDGFKPKALDRDGKPYELIAEGLLAVCIQHECDHLIGKLYPMRVRDFTKFGYTDVLFPGLDAADDD